MSKYTFFVTELEKRKSQHQRRSLNPVEPVCGVEVKVNGRLMLNFCSNDYLGLSKHPLLVQRASQFMERYGAGSTASRLICGSLTCIHEVEEKLARLKGTEAALLFNSGFQANISLLPTLTDRHSLILSDRLNHRSIVEGTLLYRCRVIRFRHNDLDHLRSLLVENRDKDYSRTVIVTESVFSVDGDRSDIDGLARLAAEFEAFLIVDEAHATGVFGPKGMGLTCGKEVDLTMGTFGKALGSFGAYVTCPEMLRDYLINYCAGFIYTTALPPSVIGAIDAALDLIPTMDSERADLQRRADSLRASLHELGFNTGGSSTQIVPVIIGREEETLALSQWLEGRGILATAIRPPTVERGESRIRLALTSLHTQEHMERLIDGFKEWAKRGS
ncbi:MAG: 8-amino-7-oxononanoate synthase [Chloroflexi bacterium]|nr:8-amino-7-oxononanoate synthase [Chloroflexota bacterium]